MENLELDDHRKSTETEKPLSIGFMVVTRGDNILEFFCSVPSRSFKHLPLAAASEKNKVC